MKKRKLYQVFLLSFFTFGIYNIIFLYQILRDLKEEFGSSEDKVIQLEKRMNRSLLELILLNIFTLGFYLLIWFYWLGIYFDYKYKIEKYKTKFLYSFFFVPYGILTVQKAINENEFYDETDYDFEIPMVPKNKKTTNVVVEKIHEKTLKKEDQEENIEKNEIVEKENELEINDDELFFYNNDFRKKSL